MCPCPGKDLGPSWAAGRHAGHIRCSGKARKTSHLPSQREPRFHTRIAPGQVMRQPIPRPGLVQPDHGARSSSPNEPLGRDEVGLYSAPRAHFWCIRAPRVPTLWACRCEWWPRGSCPRGVSVSARVRGIARTRVWAVPAPLVDRDISIRAASPGLPNFAKFHASLRTQYRPRCGFRGACSAFLGPHGVLGSFHVQNTPVAGPGGHWRAHKQWLPLALPRVVEGSFVSVHSLAPGGAKRVVRHAITAPLGGPLVP